MSTTAALPDTAEFATEAVRPASAPAQASAPAAPTQDDAGSSRAFAITSFVLGIASVVGGWTFIAPITGLILGIVALRRGTSERTFALWGVWLNAAMLALAALAVIAIALMLGAGLIALPFLAA